MARTKGSDKEERVTRTTGQHRSSGLISFRVIQGMHFEGGNAYASKEDQEKWKNTSIEGDVVQSYRRLDQIFPHRFVIISEGKLESNVPKSKGYKEEDDKDIQKRKEDKENVDLSEMTKKQLEAYARSKFGVELDRRFTMPKLILQVQKLASSEE